MPFVRTTQTRETKKEKMNSSEVLALMASLLICLSETLSPRWIDLSAIVFLAALVLLIASFRRPYLVIAAVLIVSAGTSLAVSSSSSTMDRRGSSSISSLKRRVPIALAGIFHLAGVWILPFAVLWGWSGADRHDPNFLDQEIGHVVPATFLYSALVLMPLLLMPRGYERCGLYHQRYEGSFILCSGAICFGIFRIAHHLAGDDMMRLSAPGWDHELLGLVWAGCGATGLLFAQAGVRSSVHVSVPALFVCYRMLSLSQSLVSGGGGDDVGDVTESAAETWRPTQIALNNIYGACMGLGGLCRLLNRPSESVFLFFVGSQTLVLSSIWVSRRLVVAFGHPENDSVEKYYSVDCVTSLVATTAGALMFPIHLLTLAQMRNFLEPAPPTGGFEPLRLSGDDQGGREDDGFEDKEEMYALRVAAMDDTLLDDDSLGDHSEMKKDHSLVVTA